MLSPTTHSSPVTSGFTLLEVIIALGLFIFSITAIMGVIPVGMEQVQAASNQSRGMADMEAIRDDVGLAINSGMAKSLRYGITPPAVSSTVVVDYKISEDGAVAPANGNALYRITGNLRRESATAPYYLSLRATWPAKAPAGRESGAVELFTAFQP